MAFSGFLGACISLSRAPLLKDNIMPAAFSARRRRRFFLRCPFGLRPRGESGFLSCLAFDDDWDDILNWRRLMIWRCARESRSRRQRPKFLETSPCLRLGRAFAVSGLYRHRSNEKIHEGRGYFQAAPRLVSARDFLGCFNCLSASVQERLSSFSTRAMISTPSISDRPILVVPPRPMAFDVNASSPASQARRRKQMVSPPEYTCGSPVT